MKKIFFTLCSTLIALGVYAQPGTVFFYNRVIGQVVEPVYDADAHTLLTGSGWTAQLWGALGAGATESSLIGIPTVDGGTSTFRTGAGAGYWAVTTAKLGAAGIPADAEWATFQVRVFPTAYGSWNATLFAWMSGDANARYGKSDLFSLNHIGGILNTPPSLIGLKSFTLVPEPTSGALLGLTTGFCVFSRRKRSHG